MRFTIAEVSGKSLRLSEKTCEFTVLRRLENRSFIALFTVRGVSANERSVPWASHSRLPASSMVRTRTSRAMRFTKRCCSNTCCSSGASKRRYCRHQSRTISVRYSRGGFSGRSLDFANAVTSGAKEPVAAKRSGVSPFSGRRSSAAFAVHLRRFSKSYHRTRWSTTET